MCIRNIALAWLLACGFATAAASAQTAVTANSGVVFTASTSHTLVNDDGTPTVVSYQLDTIAMNPAGAIGFTRNLGKPNLQTTGCPTTAPAPCIQVKPIAEFGAIPKGNIYTLTITAVGQPGTMPGKSPPSEQFSRPFLAPTNPAAPGLPTILP